MRTTLLSLVVVLMACGGPQTGVPSVQKQKRSFRNTGAVTLNGIPSLPKHIRKQMNRYLNERFSIFEGWDERSDGILILTRFANTTQVHRVRQPMGAREQLTFFPEPVERASWVPNSLDNSLLIQIDRGGSENYQLYRVELLESKTNKLTDAKSRTADFLWSPKGLLAYCNNSRNGRDFDIYISNATSPKDAKLVLKVDGMWTPLDFSPDERQLLLQQYVSLNESALHILDLNSGKATRITPETDKNIAYRNAVWAKNGKGIFLTSDRGGEFVQLHYLDLAKKTFAPLSDKIPWNVTELELSRDGNTLAFVVNERGWSKLNLLNTQNKKITSVDLPPGIVFGLKFSKTPSSLLGFNMIKPTAPANVYSYDMRRRKLEQWTRSEIGGLVSDFFVTPNLVQFPTFDQVDNQQRRLDTFYYKPPGDGPHPVLIYIHGGPEAQYRPQFNSFFQYLVLEMGIAVLAPNVRGSDGYGKSFLLLDNGTKREDSVKDIGALLNWIETQRELDTKRVVVYGGSYGGYMVLASLVKYGDKIKAGVDLVGISDFVTFLENTKEYRRDLRRAEYGDERDPKLRAFLKSISPLTHASKIKSRLFVIQGANDPRVPASESKQLVRAVRSNGQDVWYMLAHNEGHGFRKKTNADLARLLSAFFLDETLRRKK
ncbi:MAG: S9 family peptidase [Pseudomonadota bacterium]